MNAPTVHGIDHIGLTLPDLDQATRFFVDGLQATVLNDTYSSHQPPRDGAAVHQRLGIPPTMAERAIRMIGLPNGPGIELFEYQGTDQAPPSRPSDLGWQHLAIYVDNLDTALAQVEQAGGRRNADPADLAGPEAGDGNRFVYLRTPWDSTIELICYPSPQPYLDTTPRPKWAV